MNKRGLTLVESLVAIAILGIVGSVLVQAIPGFFGANRNSTQDQQITAAARAYMEDIHSRFKDSTNWSSDTLSLRSFSDASISSSGLSSASLDVQGKDGDSDALGTITACSSLLSQGCSPNSSYARWTFVLTLTPTNGSSQTYTMELGRQ